MFGVCRLDDAFHDLRFWYTFDGLLTGNGHVKVRQTSQLPNGRLHKPTIPVLFRQPPWFLCNVSFLWGNLWDFQDLEDGEWPWFFPQNMGEKSSKGGGFSTRTILVRWCQSILKRNENDMRNKKWYPTRMTWAVCNSIALLVLPWENGGTTIGWKSSRQIQHGTNSLLLKIGLQMEFLKSFILNSPIFILTEDQAEEPIPRPWIGLLLGNNLRDFHNLFHRDDPALG